MTDHWKSCKHESQALGQPRTPSFRKKAAPSAWLRRQRRPPRTPGGWRERKQHGPDAQEHGSLRERGSSARAEKASGPVRWLPVGPDSGAGAQRQRWGGQALTMLTSETMSMLAMSMFIPTQTGGPAGSARHSDSEAGHGVRMALRMGLRGRGTGEVPLTPTPHAHTHIAAARRKRPPPPSSTQAAKEMGRASRSGRAHPSYPRSRVLGECRSLSTACPPSPSQRTCFQDRSRWGRGRGVQRTGSGGGSLPSARRAHPRALPAARPASRQPTATLPLGAAHHRHQHWGREDAEKPSSRKAPHPSAAPRHGGGGAPPPSRPAAGAAPAAAAAAAAALARSGGGRRGRGRRGGGGAGAGRGGAAGAGAEERQEAGLAEGGAGCAAHPALPLVCRGRWPQPSALPPAPAVAERNLNPGRGRQAGAAAARRRAEPGVGCEASSSGLPATSERGDWRLQRQGQRRRGKRDPLRPVPSPGPTPHCDPHPAAAQAESQWVQFSASARGTEPCSVRKEAAGPRGSPYLTCGAQSLGFLGSRRTRWAAGALGARSTWRCSS